MAVSVPSPKIGRFNSADARAAFDVAYDSAMATMPEPAETVDVTTGFGRVRVYGFGDGGDLKRPIVLLHGRNGTSVMWRVNLPTLTRDRRVYSIDLLGEGGRSEQTAPIRSADDQAAWLHQALDGLDIEAAHLAGVSVGGWLACNQAVRAPEKVASVSLIDPINTFAPMPVAMILRTLPTVLPVVSRWARPWFLRWIDGQGTEIAGIPEAEVISAAMEHYRPALPVPTYFSDDQLCGIGVPAFAVIAGRSVVHDPQRAYTRARTLIPEVRAELWPDATHAISGRYADEVGARIVGFVDELESAEDLS
jgi:pimeloyl-ACP methyl ester carboxylesterase